MNDNDRRKYLRLLDEKRILELETDIAAMTALLKVDKIIDHLTTTVLNKDVAAIKSMKRVENVMKVWHRDIDTSIDENCVGCCKVVDIAADLQEKLDDTTDLYNAYFKRWSEQVNIIKGLREQIKNQSTSIGGLINNVERTKDSNREYRSTIKGLEEKLSACKEDSEVLMKVVEIIKDESVSNSKASALVGVAVKDYLDAPEGLKDKTVDELEFDVDYSPDEGYSITTTAPDGEKRYLLLGVKP